MLKRFAVIVALALPFGGAMAQDAPTPPLAKTVPAFTCTAETEGQLSCQAAKSCKCGYKPAEAGTGLPARWAWDCGVMRPQCERAPADATRHGREVPVVIIERKSDESEKSN